MKKIETMNPQLIYKPTAQPKNLHTLIRPTTAMLLTFGMFIALIWLAALPLVKVEAAGNFSGTVYLDSDQDGAFDTSDPIDPGVGGVTVKAFNAAGTAVATATTASNGTYTLNLATIANGTPLRVEFTNIPAGKFPGRIGSDNFSTVRFTTAGAAATLNLGLNDPTVANQNPLVAVTAQVNGGLNTLDFTRSMYRFPYTSSGNDNTEAATTSLATKIDTGSLWGLAYSRTRDTLYSAEVLRRHAAMYESPANTPRPGQIFRVADASLPAGSTDAVTPFFNVGAVAGVSVGTVQSNTARGLSPSVRSGDQSVDAAAFAQVGKVGLGDLDISPDEANLWTVSLNDKKLVRMTLDTAGAVTASTSFAIPAPTGAFACTNGTHRPFALEFSGTKLYVGMICDAANAGGTAANLKAVVMTTPWATPGTFTQLFQTSLNYTKGYVNENCTSIGAFIPWKDSAPTINCGSFMIYPQPLLTDMEIDADGSLIMAFKDRAGLQMGRENLAPDGTTRETNFNGGEILRACNVGGNLVIQGSAGCAVKSANNEGPGGGEWYFGDLSGNFGGASVPAHLENILGGTAMIAGRGEVIATCYSCFNIGFFNNGVVRMNNSTGANVTTFEVNEEGQGFAKSGGLGDMEVLDTPAPLEIGNRVWRDNNNNGIQDAGEPGISGVPVQLYVNNVLIATVTTDSNGNYLFSSAAFENAGGTIYNVPFELRIPKANYPAGTVPTGTTTDASANGTSRDSNGVTTTNYVAAAGTTGAVGGANNHTYDFGFKAAAATAAEVNLAGRVVDASGRGISRAIVQMLDTKTGAARITQTNSRGNYSFEGIDLNSFVIITIDKAGYKFTPSQQAMSLTESLTNVDFVSERQGKGVR